MRALDRKLCRDLERMAPQLAAVALVVASGVALFIATMTTYRSLRLSEAHYYVEVATRSGKCMRELGSGRHPLLQPTPMVQPSPWARAPAACSRDEGHIPTNTSVSSPRSA